MFTDHKPLTFALIRVSLPWKARQQHHLSCLSEFTSDLVHLPSPQNKAADALSHPSSIPLPAASALTVEMVQGQGLNSFREFLPGSLHLVWFHFSLSPLCSLCPPPCLWISPYCPPCSSPAQKPLLFSVTLLSRLSLCPMVSPLSSVTSPLVLPGL